MMWRRLCMTYCVIGAMSFGTTISAQPMHSAWRGVNAQLECFALAHRAFWDDGKTADMHWKAAVGIVSSNPGLLNTPMPDFITNRSGGERFVLPASAVGDTQLSLRHIAGVIVAETQLRILGPDPVYPEGMTVSPSAENEVMERENYALEYRQRSCARLLNE